MQDTKQTIYLVELMARLPRTMWKALLEVRIDRNKFFYSVFVSLSLNEIVRMKYASMRNETQKY